MIVLKNPTTRGCADKRHRESIRPRPHRDRARPVPREHQPGRAATRHEPAAPRRQRQIQRCAPTPRRAPQQRRRAQQHRPMPITRADHSLRRAQIADDTITRRNPQPPPRIPRDHRRKQPLRKTNSRLGRQPTEPRPRQPALPRCTRTAQHTLTTPKRPQLSRRAPNRLPQSRLTGRRGQRQRPPSRPRHTHRPRDRASAQPTHDHRHTHHQNQPPPTTKTPHRAVLPADLHRPPKSTRPRAPQHHPDIHIPFPKGLSATYQENQPTPPPTDAAQNVPPASSALRLGRATVGPFPRQGIPTMPRCYRDRVPG